MRLIHARKRQIDRQRHADHAGGGTEHLGGIAAPHFGDPRRLRLRGLATVHAGEGVAVAGIDDQPPRLALRQFRPAQFHFRRGAF